MNFLSIMLLLLLLCFVIVSSGRKIISPSHSPRVQRSTPTGSRTTGDASSIFVNIPNPNSSLNTLQALTQSPSELQISTYNPLIEPTDPTYVLIEQLKSYGFTPTISKFEAPLNFPDKRKVDLIFPENATYEARLKEAPVESDPFTQNSKVIPPYIAYSATATVSGELVYVNYGTEEDYQALKNIGVDVEGKIVIARYGINFRGAKVLLAQQRGAIGILIYSDPANYQTQASYPNGEGLPITGVQRGTALYTHVCPGMPTAARLTSKCFVTKNNPLEISTSIPTIPVQPLSAQDALPFLKNLGVNQVPDPSWQGELDIEEYFVGPGPAKVNLSIQSDTRTTQLYNIFVTIPGQSDQLVILGNHRDAWTYGASDPRSGTAALLEVARGFSQLLKQGWKPYRSILLASWDAEEFGLIGSTFFGEQNQTSLQDKAVAYLNVDQAVSGTQLLIRGTPSLGQAIRSAAKMVKAPGSTQKTIFDIWQTKQLTPLGSGSDYAVFLNYLGIPSADFSFNGSEPLYHSLYEDYDWATKTFNRLNQVPFQEYITAIAKLWGLTAIILADEMILPYNFTEYTQSLETWVGTLESLIHAYNGTSDDSKFLSNLKSSINTFATAAKQTEQEYVSLLESHNLSRLARSTPKKLTRKRLAYASKGNKATPSGTPSETTSSTPSETTSSTPSATESGKPPKSTKSSESAKPSESAKSPTESSALSPILPPNPSKASSTLSATSTESDDEDESTIENYNERVLYCERKFLSRDGLVQQGRSWYKHLLVAPLLSNGYLAETFPGISEAVRKSDWSTASQQAGVVSSQIKAAAAQLKGDKGSSISTGAAIGIAIGIFVGVILLLGLGYLIYRKAKYRSLSQNR